MRASTGRHRPEVDRYWRRRAVSLAGVLGVLGLFAWACTGDAEPVRDAGAVESASPPPAPTAMPTVTVTATAAPEPEAAGGPCGGEDIVVTMSAAKTAYRGSERPEFRITVVNTAMGWCTFDTGSLDVRITSGSDAIWSSAECRRGGASKKTLERGVPYIGTVTWDRKRGCGQSPARPGTYVAELKGHEVEGEVFHLR